MAKNMATSIKQLNMRNYGFCAWGQKQLSASPQSHDLGITPTVRYSGVLWLPELSVFLQSDN